jgi:hypothetical protein
MSVCICNPYAEPDAPRVPNCPIHSELARCDREIARICEEARAGIGDAHGIFQGLHDWRTEKKLIAASTPVQPYLIVDRVWIEIKDGDASARAIFRRHYSYKPYRDGRNPALFVGPGEKMVLLTPCALALFIWRKFISGDGQKGVNCAVFRNEGAGRASDLIREAMRLAWNRWPSERLFTYVNPKKIRRTRTPGRCFLKAGWRYVRDERGKRVLTKWRRLPILEALPEWFSPTPTANERTSIPNPQPALNSTTKDNPSD